jgi:hypothetical protein
VVQEVGVHHEILRANTAAPMNPASVMKLVTTYAALEQLGPAYRWRTEVYITGTLADGVLDGDLVLKGGGDPKLDLEAFWRLVRALRGKGLREIRGSLLIDRSRFALGEGDAGRFDGDPFRPYNVLPDALLVNYKSLRFVFLPEPERAAVRVYVEPRPPALELVNALTLSQGGCPEGSAFRDMLKRLRASAPACDLLAVSGQPWREGPQRRAARLTTMAGVPAALDGKRRNPDGSARDRPAARNPFMSMNAGAGRDRARHQQVLQQHHGAAFVPDAGHRGPRLVREHAEIGRRRARLDRREEHRRARAGDGERLGTFAHRAHQRGQPRRPAAGRLDEPGDARVHRLDADCRHRRHHAAPREGRRGHRPGAREDRAALGRARHGRLRARSARPPPGRGDDRQPRRSSAPSWMRCCAGPTSGKKRR